MSGDWSSDVCSSDLWKLPFRVQRVEPCENMGPNWVPNVPMTYTNTTKEKSPWSYPLSTPVEGVDEMVDFRSTVGGGFRRNRGPRSVGTTPKPRWCHIICVRVWWEASRANMILRGVTGFTNHTYPARRFCSSRWKLPFRVQRMESCDNMCPNWVPYVHMPHPNTTKYKSPWSYPFRRPSKG